MSRLKIFLVVLLPFVLLAQSENTIEIGTFNIEWFPCKDDGEMMKQYDINLRRPPTGQATDIEALFTLLKDLDIEVLGVVEIVDPALLESAARKYLGGQFKVIYAPGAGSQRVGFLYDTTAVRLIGSPQVYSDVALGPDTWLRPALRAYFKSIPGGFDFHAIVVHLKASPSGWDQRKRQWNVLENLLARIREDTGDDDIILTGDFNNVSQLGNDEFLPIMKRLNFVWATEELKNKNIFTNYWQPDYKEERIEGSLIDQIFVSADAAVEFVENSVRAGGMCAQKEPEFKGADIPEFYRRISDHCPVYASFKCDKDDD